ncbi:MAG: outer membrane beta-barrel protein [Bacteroidetes bacterium]|nr:outer membrane beta-barrel protein [Bacteroidota bacterium]
MKRINITIVFILTSLLGFSQANLPFDALAADKAIKDLLISYSNFYNHKEYVKDAKPDYSAIGELFADNIIIRNDCNPGKSTPIVLKEYINYLSEHFQLGLNVMFNDPVIIKEKADENVKVLKIRYSKEIFGYYDLKQPFRRTINEMITLVLNKDGKWKISAIEIISDPLFFIDFLAGPSFGSFNMGNSVVDYPLEGYSSKDKTTFNYGLELGFRIVDQLSVKTGLIFASYKTSITSNYLNQEPVKSVDKDSESYYLYTEASDIKEELNLKYYKIPIKLQYVFMHERKVSPFIGAGLNYCIYASSGSNISGISTQEGYYPQYHAVLYDIPELGFMTNHAFDQEIEPGFKDYSLSGEFSAGIVTPIYLNKIYFIVNASYEIGFTNIIEEDTYYLSTKAREYNSLILSRDQVKMNSFTIYAGLRFGIK